MNATVPPLPLCTTESLFTPTVVAIAPPSRALERDRAPLAVVRGGPNDGAGAVRVLGPQVVYREPHERRARRGAHVAERRGRVLEGEPAAEPRAEPRDGVGPLLRAPGLAVQ